MTRTRGPAAAFLEAAQLPCAAPAHVEGPGPGHAYKCVKVTWSGADSAEISSEVYQTDGNGSASGQVPPGSVGACYGRLIELGRVALDSVEGCVIHELVHCYADDSPCASQPHCVEEGLAHYVARKITGSPAPEATDARFDPTHLWYDAEQWGVLSEAQGGGLMLVGHGVVDRLGLPRMRELAAAGASPPEYLEAAGLSPQVHHRDGSGGRAVPDAAAD